MVAGMVALGDIAESLGPTPKSDQPKKHEGLWLLCSRPPLFPLLAVPRHCWVTARATSASVTWPPPHASEQPQALPHPLPCRSQFPSRKPLSPPPWPRPSSCTWMGLQREPLGRHQPSPPGQLVSSPELSPSLGGGSHRTLLLQGRLRLRAQEVFLSVALLRRRGAWSQGATVLHPVPPGPWSHGCPGPRGFPCPSLPSCAHVPRSQPHLPWTAGTYRPEVSVELVVLPQVGQEAGGCPGGLLTVRAGG